MPLYNTDAVVLKSINLGEADKIVTFFTHRYGKIQGVAKGARRLKSRFGASLEPITHINLIYFGKENANLYKINSCDILEPFSKCKDDLDKLKRVLFLCDLINSTLHEQDVNLKVFELLLKTLHIFTEIEGLERLDTAMDIFSLRFLSAVGFAPKLTHCVYCNKNPSYDYRGSNGIGFHVVKGGIVCGDCLPASEDSIRTNSGIINFIKKSISINPSNLDRLILSREMERDLHKIIRLYIYAHIDREIKSYDFLN